jgi:hypothetical protein
MRIVPSEVIALIDQFLPWAKGWSLATKGDARDQSGDAAVSWLSGFAELLDQIPNELLLLGAHGASEFLIARAALGRAAER